MEIPRAQSPPPPFLPDELVMEILSWVPPKPVLRFRCVCNSWKSVISDPSFVKLHLQRSPKNANLILTLRPQGLPRFNERDACVLSCSKLSFPEKPLSSAAAEDGCYPLKDKYRVVGSCNGLVFLRGYLAGDEFGEYWVRFWNPATRLGSKKSPRLRIDLRIHPLGSTKFGFGYDKSSDTYKVVAVHSDRNAIGDSQRTQVKVYGMGDNCWRNIQSFPAFPFPSRNEGRFLSGTLNWLALRNFDPGYKWDTVTIDQLVIVSLDLGKETYKQLLLPDGLDEVPRDKPILGVMMDCLCLSHDHKKTHFVVWQMKEFGVEKSWTRFVNVSYEHLQIQKSLTGNYSLVPLCISENGDVLMLIGDYDCETILYHRRDNRVEHIRIPNEKLWIEAKNYVPSLVLPYKKLSSSATV